MLSDGLFQHLPPSILHWRKDGFRLADPHRVHSAFRKKKKETDWFVEKQTKVSLYCKNNHSKCVNLIDQSVMLSPINMVLPQGLVSPENMLYWPLRNPMVKISNTDKIVKGCQHHELS